MQPSSLTVRPAGERFTASVYILIKSGGESGMNCSRALARGVAWILILATARSAAAQSVVARQENLRVTAADGVVLAGTLYTPGGAGPYVTVVLVHGSEPGERRNPGYQRWATTLVAAGFACLVVDKRGVGESGGVYTEAPPLEAPAADLLAWIEALRSRPAVRKDAIGLLGWSQAGWVAPLAASRSDAVAFLAVISGSGVSPLEQGIYDKTNQVLAQGLADDQAALATEAIRRVMTYLVTGADEAGAEAAWESVRNAPWFTSTYTGVPMMDRDTLLADPRGGAFVAHSLYDPAPALAALHIPVLWLFGDADRVVPVEASIAALERSMGSAARFQHWTFAGANHALGVTADDGTMRLHPDVYPTIIRWIRSVTEPH